MRGPAFTARVVDVVSTYTTCKLMARWTHEGTTVLYGAHIKHTVVYTIAMILYKGAVRAGTTCLWLCFLMYSIYTPQSSVSAQVHPGSDRLPDPEPDAQARRATMSS